MRVAHTAAAGGGLSRLPAAIRPPGRRTKVPVFSHDGFSAIGYGLIRLALPFLFGNLWKICVSSEKAGVSPAKTLGNGKCQGGTNVYIDDPNSWKDRDNADKFCKKDIKKDYGFLIRLCRD